MLRHRLVAHRGYQQHFPENTLRAMRAAVAAGALYVETDIQFSRDLKPLLYHDSLLMRVSGRDGRIDDLDEAELLGIPAHEPFRFGDTFADETIAPLSALVDFLRATPELTVFIEIKEEAIAHAGIAKAYEILTSYLTPIASQVVLISFDVPFIAHARAQGFAQLGIVLKSWAQIDSEETLAIAPQYLFINVKRIPANENLGRIESLLVVYEIAEPEAAIALFNRGADMVETFDIGGMITGLSSHTL
ncbi:MAG: glycerophosphodiester phosphodiesterase family protein [Porticoccaceae bacterium]